MIRRLQLFRFGENRLLGMATWGIVFSLIALNASAQTTTVRGKVTSSDDGSVLPGVNIMVKGTTIGATSGADGTYSIDAASKDVLVFSFIGYETTEIAVGQQTTIDLALNLDIVGLGEVVVVGYGEQQSSNISGSVSTVSIDKMSKNPAPNLSNTLAGQTAGIIATQPTGEPGNDNSRILIRGVGTTGNTDPLYVIDGIVRSSSDFFQLNPSEIESVSILKDAASAAVFGMQAGNGVILVTTKRGKEGRMQIAFSSNFGVQQRTIEPDFVNSYEYATLRNAALANAGLPLEYTDEDLQKYQDGSSPDTHPDTDWQSLLRKTAPIQQHNLSVTGGTDKIKFATSVSSLSQDGIAPSNNFTRYNFRSNIDANVTKTTKLSFDLSGRKQKNESLGKSDELFRWMNTQPNKFPIRWSNGGYSSGPAYIAEPANGYRRTEEKALRTRLELEQHIPFIEGLSVRLIGSYDNTDLGHKNWYYPVVPFYTLLPDGSFKEEPLPANYLDVDTNDEESTTLQTHLNYEQTFGKLDLSALVLYTQTETNWNFVSGHREGYTIGIDELDFGGTVNRNNRGYSGSSGRQGIVGRLNLSYDNKYIFETSVRVDGSEQFAPDQRWGVFPSVSGAYIISEESFMSDVSVIDMLKIRASYGVLGNDRLRLNNQDVRFLYLQSYNINAGRYPVAIFGDGSVYQTVSEGRLASPNVTWETVKKFDIGFDALFLDAKMSVTMDYFFDKRTDILGERATTVPGMFGISLPIENLTKIDNKGIELTLGYKDGVGEDFSYSLNANMTYTKNKVVYFDEPADLNPNLRQTGQPINMTYGYKALGLFQTQEEVDNWATQKGNNAPGDVKIADIDDNGVIDANDRIPIGVVSNSTSVPGIIYGIGGQLMYKNFEFSFLFQGATKVNHYASGEGNFPFQGESSVVRSNLNYWTPDNTGAHNPRILIGPQNMNHEYSSWWMRDGSYLRLKNVELGYNVPTGFLGQNFIQGLHIYVNANNVFTWTKLENWDPEYADPRAWVYPQLRVWNAGFNVRF
jgi:TonB-linked SusC/RagA family outer membrane protein